MDSVRILTLNKTNRMVVTKVYVFKKRILSRGKRKDF